MHLDFDTFTRYTHEERDKWREWFTSHPDALDVEVQPGGRFATVGALIDHIFIVERRHLQRGSGEPRDPKKGVWGGHPAARVD
jgi:uncharacterized damage-inducible protein DinB